MAGAQETRDGVALTNLDQPLFDGAGATKRDLVDYLDAVRDRILPGAARPAAVGDPGAARAGAVHAEEPAEVHARTGCATVTSGRRRPSARWPTRSATTAARCCGSPTSGRSSTTRRWSAPTGRDQPDPPGARPRPARGRRLRARWSRPPQLVRQALADVGLAGAVKTSGAKGVHVFVPVDDGADHRGRGRRHPGASRRAPSASTRRSPRPRSSARTGGGKVFVDSTRAGGATVVAAYSPRLRPGLPVSFPVGLGRPRRRHARPTSPCARRPTCSATRDPWADAMPAPQTAARRPGRGGPHHPGRPGAGDARGQAPRRARREAP